MNDAQGPNPNEATDPRDELALDRATGDAPREPGESLTGAQRDASLRTAAALQAGMTPPSEPPRELRDRLLADGIALVGARNPLIDAAEPPVQRSKWGPVFIAASLLLATIVGVTGYLAVRERDGALENERRALDEQRTLVADLRQQITENTAALARAQQRVDTLVAEYQSLEASAAAQESELLATREREARLARENTESARRLADASAELLRLERDLRLAQLEVASYEASPDPEAIRQNRQKLLEVDGTIVADMRTFDVPDLPPAEQPEVRGDVVWNDELQTGYMRFVGLDPNDPDIEQYQVWVIDERGLEQKVSGGVFNVSSEGEVIVPITPGIDVGRVALFAVTVERPGGTWVPDLQRRIVVAPREDG
ncbi:MAG: hypothetical protein Tsb0013_06400 [Phycisphaerales bacterium]